MRAKAVLKEEAITDYFNSIKRMTDFSNLKDKNVMDFLPYTEDQEFFLVTSIPIPSCKCFDIDLVTENGITSPRFYYKIFIKGSFNEDFKSFIFDGKMDNYSFYGAVYDLVVFKERKDLNYETFQISFNSLNSLYEILQTQRKCDFNYRLKWFQSNFNLIYKTFDEYKNLEQQKKNLVLEQKQNKLKKDKYYFSLKKNSTYSEAEYTLNCLFKELKNMKKNIFYPKFMYYDELKLRITQEKVRVVSFSKTEDGAYIFYYYK